MALNTIKICVMALKRYIFLFFSRCSIFLPLTGDLLIIMAQIIVAVQMVYEERVINRFVIHPLEAVGWEGNYLTVVSSTQTKVICLYKAYITVTSFHYLSLIFIVILYL